MDDKLLSSLSEAQKEIIYRQQLHVYNLNDAKYRTEERIDTDDDIAACPWVASKLSIETGKQDALLHEMAREFEEKKDCNVADNTVWEGIVERNIIPLVHVIAVDHVMQRLPDIVSDADAWHAFSALINLGPNGTPLNKTANEALDRALHARLREMAAQPNDVTLSIVRNAIEENPYHVILQFCSKHKI